jgi:predicted nucleic acid-binding protein
MPIEKKKEEMSMLPMIAVLDANVLFSAPLRDTLLRAAELDLYQVRWTPEILEEVRRNLSKKGKSSEAKAQRLIDTISSVFHDAQVVEDYHSLIPLMTNHIKDRHVLAAAAASHAQTIVTFNLRDFPPSSLEPYGIVVLPPDSFLAQLFATHSDEMTAIISEQVNDLRNPPLTLDQVLDALAKQAPSFIQRMRARFAQIQEGNAN